MRSPAPEPAGRVIPAPSRVRRPRFRRCGAARACRPERIDNDEGQGRSASLNREEELPTGVLTPGHEEVTASESKQNLLQQKVGIGKFFGRRFVAATAVLNGFQTLSDTGRSASRILRSRREDICPPSEGPRSPGLLLFRQGRPVDSITWWPNTSPRGRWRSVKVGF